MSQNLYFQPLTPKIIETMSPTGTIEILERAFGEFPITLTEKDAPKLKGIQAANPGNEAWRQIIDELYAHVRIMLTKS